MLANKTKFGASLKAIRKGLNLTQTEVAKSTGIKQPAITRLEKGTGTIDNLIILIAFYTTHSPDHEIDVFSFERPIIKKKINQSLNFISIERLKVLQTQINSEIEDIISQMHEINYIVE